MVVFVSKGHGGEEITLNSRHAQRGVHMSVCQARNTALDKPAESPNRT